MNAQLTYFSEFSTKNKMSVLNTHTYDGKLNRESVGELTLSETEKKERANELLSYVSDNVAKHFLRQIIDDFGKPANFDPSNSLRADDLVCLCWTHRENKDFVSLLQLQLRDMSTGFCPQGRTHRLFQLLLAFNLKS